MNSKLSKELLKELANKYGITYDEARYIIMRYFEKIHNVMKESNINTGSYKNIIIKGTGKFILPYFKVISHKMYNRSNEMKNETLDKTEYKIKLQEENDKTFENNEPFFFMAEDTELKSLKTGSDVFFKVFFETKGKRKQDLFFRGEIIDAKYPFYEAAIYVNDDKNEKPSEVVLFKRKHVKTILI